MLVLNEVAPSAVDGPVAEVRGARYDRFYVLEDALLPGELPSDSPAFGLTWIGEQFDWSGVAAVPWATMISPSFCVLADHADPGRPDAYFFLTNSQVEVPLALQIDLRIAGDETFGNDLLLKKLAGPIHGAHVSYPVLAYESPQDMVGMDLYVVGQSNAHPQFFGKRHLRMRLGRNTISGVGSSSVDLEDGSRQPTPPDSSYFMNFDFSVADISGPDMLGDGLIDQFDADVMNMSATIADANSNALFTYVEGAIDPAGANLSQINFSDGVLFTVEVFQNGGDAELVDGLIDVTSAGETGVSGGTKPIQWVVIRADRVSL